MPPTLTLPQEFVLIALDPEGNSFLDTAERREEGIVDCALFELKSRWRIRINDKTVQLVDPEATGDALLDRLLGAIRGSSVERTTNDWISRFGSLPRHPLFEEVAAQLVAMGCLRSEDHKRLGFINVRKYLPADATLENAAKTRLRQIIAGEEQANARDWWLLDLIYYYGLEGGLYSRQELLAARSRLAMLLKSDRQTAPTAATPVPAVAVSAPSAAASSLPNSLPAPKGKIVGVQGTVIDVQFEAAHSPAILGALTVTVPYSAAPGTFCVVQHQRPGLVRAVSLSLLPNVTVGLEVLDTGTPVNDPIPETVLFQAVREMAGTGTLPTQTLTQTIETGLKAIDLLCPLIQNGSVGLFAEWGTGALVILPELLHNLGGQAGMLRWFAFVPPTPDDTRWRQNDTEIVSHAGFEHLIVFPVANPHASSLRTGLEFLDTVIHLAPPLAKRGLYPPIDFLFSASRALIAAPAGSEAADIAASARQLLRQYRELQPVLQSAGWENLQPQERQAITRGSRLERYLFSQPFTVAEPYTGIPGEYVPCAQTLQDCKAILAGTVDHLPEQAFIMVGTLAQAVQKAERLQSEAS